MNEKVARWLFENEQERMDGEDWDSIQGRPLWEKVVKRYVAKARELLSLIDQQGEPVGWVSSYQLEQVASDPRILGVVTTLYKHKPEGTTFHVPLYLHPPASQEREALAKKFREWALTCKKSEAVHREEDNCPSESYHRGAKEAFNRCADAILAEGGEGDELD